MERLKKATLTMNKSVLTHEIVMNDGEDEDTEEQKGEELNPSVI